MRLYVYFQLAYVLEALPHISLSVTSLASSEQRERTSRSHTIPHSPDCIPCFFQDAFPETQELTLQYWV